MKKRMTLEEVLKTFKDEEFSLEINYVKLYNLTSDMFKYKRYSETSPAYEIEYRSGNVCFNCLNCDTLRADQESETVTYKNSNLKVSYTNLTWERAEKWADDCGE